MKKMKLLRVAVALCCVCAIFASMNEPVAVMQTSSTWSYKIVCQNSSWASKSYYIYFPTGSTSGTTYDCVGKGSHLNQASDLKVRPYPFHVEYVFHTNGCGIPGGTISERRSPNYLTILHCDSSGKTYGDPIRINGKEGATLSGSIDIAPNTGIRCEYNTGYWYYFKNHGGGYFEEKSGAFDAYVELANLRSHKIVGTSSSQTSKSYYIYLPTGSASGTTYDCVRKESHLNQASDMKVRPYPFHVEYVFHTNGCGIPGGTISERRSPNYLTILHCDSSGKTYGDPIRINGKEGATLSGSIDIAPNTGIRCEYNTGYWYYFKNHGGGYFEEKSGAFEAYVELAYQLDWTAPNIPTPELLTFPDDPYTKKINGTYHSGRNPTNIQWSNPGDPGLFSSGVTKYKIFNNGNYITEITADSSVSSYSYPITVEGSHKLQVQAVDYENNASPLSTAVAVVTDFSTSDPVLSADPIQVVINNQNKYDVTFKWNAVADISGVAYQVALIKADTVPDNSEIINVAGNQYTFSNVAFSKVFYAYIRAIDGVGNTSGWTKSSFTMASPCAIREIKSYSKLQDNQPYYEIALDLEDVSAASYIIERRLKGESARKTVAELTQAQLKTGGFIYTDSSNLVKHGEYIYYVYTKDNSGQRSVENSAKVVVANIQPKPVATGPRSVVMYTDVTFKLHDAKDQEGDQLEYRLYLKKKGDNWGTPYKTIIPAGDDQSFSITLEDTTDYQWYLACIESNSGIVDREEVTVLPSSPLYINTRYPLLLCSNDFVHDAYDNMWGTMGQPLSFRVESNPLADFKTFSWDFGDGTPLQTGLQTTHSYKQLSGINNPFKIVVTAKDSNNHTYQGIAHIRIINTPKGRLYADEVWSGSHTFEGDITVPAGISLQIKPDTKVSVKPNCGLIIFGTLQTNGTEIAFDIVSGSGGTWKGIRFNQGGAGILNGITISNAVRAIACTGKGEININNCAFKQNNTGLHCYSGTITVKASSFSGNTLYGVKEDNGCSPKLDSCSFTGNGIDYYDTEKFGISAEQIVNCKGRK